MICANACDIIKTQIKSTLKYKNNADKTESAIGKTEKHTNENKKHKTKRQKDIAQ